MATIAITGTASGIGAAPPERLVREGHRMIGVDLRDADLSTTDGREAAITRIRAACGDVLDGLVVSMSLGPQVPDRGLIAPVNYFGSQVLLAGLRDGLERGDRTAAVAISSTPRTKG